MKFYQMDIPAIQRDLYMDDLLSGGNSPAEVKVLKENIEKILADAHFVMKKWGSNDPDLRVFLSHRR